HIYRNSFPTRRSSDLDIKNIQTTMSQLNVEEFEQAASYILQANRVYIIANRSAVSLGTFLQYYFNIILGKSELVTTTEAAFDQIDRKSTRLNSSHVSI